MAKHIKPNAKGELEITTANQALLKDGELKILVFGRCFTWLDTGTHDSMTEVSTFVEVMKVACLEGIAYRNSWISKDRMLKIGEANAKISVWSVFTESN